MVKELPTSSPSPSRHPLNRTTARSTSWAVVCQLTTETRMQRLPRQVAALKKASPVAAMAATTSSVRRSWSASSASGSGIEEADQSLIHLWLPQDLGAVELADLRDDLRRVMAAALDQSEMPVRPNWRMAA